MSDLYVDLECLLMQKVLQLEYLMIIFCLYQTLNSIGFPFWVHFYNIPPITNTIISDFFLIYRAFWSPEIYYENKCYFSNSEKLCIVI